MSCDFQLSQLHTPYRVLILEDFIPAACDYEHGANRLPNLLRYLEPHEYDVGGFTINPNDLLLGVPLGGTMKDVGSCLWAFTPTLTDNTSPHPSVYTAKASGRIRTRQL